MLIDAVDTYYEYVKNRIISGVNDTNGNVILAPNPQQKFMGYAEAQSWPPSDILFGALYLLVTNQDNQPRLGTLGNQMYRSVLQWTWIIQGSDLSSTTTGANRGNRFRLDQTMREQLRIANFPQFCPLITVQQNPTTGVTTKVPYNPVQTCRWTPLSFGPRPSAADESGVLYGAAAVDVYAFQQPLTQ